MAVHRRRSSVTKELTSQDAKSLPGELRRLAIANNIKIEPLDIRKLIEFLGIRVIREPMADDRSGYLTRRNGRWIIGVNSLHHPRRQRFTLTHELAHYLLHRSQQEGFEDTIFFRGQDIDPREREANRFAGQMLMPEGRFKELVRSGVRDLDDLARIFGTSTLAVKVRASELGFRITDT